jgi:hypothetical protein
MDANITVNSITFNKSFDTEEGSERRSSARGINLPDILSIKRQASVDSKSKEPAMRFSPRFDRWNETAEGKRYCVSVYTVLVVPESATQDDVDTVVATHRAFTASTTPNYLTAVLNSES